MSGGPLNAKALALQTIRCAGKSYTFFSHQFGWRVVVLHGEVDFLLSLLGDGHRGNNGVEFFCQQGGDHAIPFLLNQNTFAIKALADFHGEVDVEAF